MRVNVETDSCPVLASIPLDQRAPGSFDYVDLPDPAVEPPIDYPAPVAKPLGPPPPPLSIKELCAFIDLLEVGPPDQHFQPGRRKGKNGNASRPPNAFLLFRSHFWRYHKEKTLVRDHREISRMAAICWRSIDESKQVPYKKLAKQLKDEHAQLYPQHKYNLSAKERSARGKNKTGGDELCYVVAAQVAQDARASESPQTPELSEGGVLGAPAVVTVKKASKSKPRPFQPSVKRGKRNLHKPSVAAIPVSVTRVQTDHSLLVGPPFAPNSEIPHLTHPPSSIPPEVNFLDIAAGFVSFVSLGTLGFEYHELTVCCPAKRTYPTTITDIDSSGDAVPWVHTFGSTRTVLPRGPERPGRCRGPAIEQSLRVGGPRSRTGLQHLHG